MPGQCCSKLSHHYFVPFVPDNYILKMPVQSENLIYMSILSGFQHEIQVQQGFHRICRKLRKCPVLKLLNAVHAARPPSGEAVPPVARQHPVANCFSPTWPARARGPTQLAEMHIAQQKAEDSSPVSSSRRRRACGRRSLLDNGHFSMAASTSKPKKYFRAAEEGAGRAPPPRCNLARSHSISSL